MYLLTHSLTHSPIHAFTFPVSVPRAKYTQSSPHPCLDTRYTTIHPRQGYVGQTVLLASPHSDNYRHMTTQGLWLPCTWSGGDVVVGSSEVVPIPVPVAGWSSSHCQRARAPAPQRPPSPQTPASHHELCCPLLPSMPPMKSKSMDKGIIRLQACASCLQSILGYKQLHA